MTVINSELHDSLYREFSLTDATDSQLNECPVCWRQWQVEDYIEVLLHRSKVAE